MKNASYIYVIVILLITLASVSCTKEKDKPVIIDLEVGYENSHQVMQGSDLHIEASIEALNRIEFIQVTIHPEGEHGSVKMAEEDHWEVDTTYLNFKDLRSTVFHEHINVPTDAEPGDYHFHLVVVDQEGFSTESEVELEVQ